MLLAFGSKEAHYFVHHQHIEVKICNDTPQNEHHFHDKDYIHTDCALCDFTFSVFALSFTQKFDFVESPTLISTQIFPYSSHFSSRFPAFALLRGPPVFS
jgi:hypothetical protein